MDDQGMNKLKNTAKKAGSLLNKIIPKKAKKIIIIAVAVIAVIAIIAVSNDYLDVQNALFPGSEDDSDYNEYCPLAYFNNIYVTDDGTLMPGTSVQDMWDHDKRYGHYLSSVDALSYLLNAQVVSQYPYIESAENDQLNGTVKFYRNNSEAPMKYVSQDTLDGYISSYNNSRK